jgi:hypothetical protein
MADVTDHRRRTFGPVVVTGLAGAGLAAMAGNEPWLARDPGATDCVDPFFRLLPESAPATTAVALALLAAWGVALVTRGRVRRPVAVLILLLALCLAVTVVFGAETDECSHRTGWYWVAVVALPLAVGAAVLAVLWVRAWPEMGRKYDAPTSGSPASQKVPEKAPEEQENLDLWKAMDEGHDPTA